MAGDINRVTLVGNLTRDPELRHIPSGTAVLELGLAVNGRQQDEAGQWVDKPNFFDVKVSGSRPRARASTSRRAAGSASTAASTGARGRRRTARSARRSRSSPQNVQFLDSRGDGEGGGGESGGRYVPAAAPARGRLPVLADRRRHPVLGGDDMAAEDTTAQARQRPGRPAGGARAATSARTRSQRWTTRTSTSCGATSPRRARSATAASPARAAATSGRSRSRSSGPARWRCCRTSQGRRDGRDPAQGRGEARPEGRGRRRQARLCPQLPAAAAARRGRDAGPGRGDPADRGRSAPATRRGRPSRPTRSRRRSARPCCASRSRPARPARCSARSRRRTSPRSSGGRARSASTGARSTST